MEKFKSWFDLYNRTTTGSLEKGKDLKKEHRLKKAGSEQLELELNIPRTLRTEFNFLRFPFFDLSKDSNRKKIKIEEWVDTKEGKFHLFWLVTRDVESQFPGDFEKRLHRAIEQIINANPKPIENPLRLGSLRNIARLMGINPDSGKNREDIQKSFKNIVKASIEADGTFQLKQSKAKKYIKDTFHLYDRVILKGEELPDGRVADCVYLMLGSWYLNNINQNYVVPLDWYFYNQLTGSITTRMYEFLSIHFYATLERGSHYQDLRYSLICSYFPLKRQYPAWKAKKQLKHAHESLINSGFFSKVEWLDSTDKGDWILRYWIGNRAREEYKNNKEQYNIGPIGAKPIPIPDRRRNKKHEYNQEEKELIEELKKRRVSKNKAKELVRNYDFDKINYQIEHYDYLVSIEKQPNGGGWLKEAIENDYIAPQEFTTRAEREERANKAKQKAEQKLQQEKAQQEKEEQEKQEAEKQKKHYDGLFKKIPKAEQDLIISEVEDILKRESSFIYDRYIKAKNKGEDISKMPSIEIVFLDHRNKILNDRYENNGGKS